MTEKVKGRLVLLLVYLIAFGLAFYVSSVNDYSLLLKALLAIGLAVTIIFLGSVDFNNSSVFDPYWSVAPVLFTVYFWVLGSGQGPGYWSLVGGGWSGIAFDWTLVTGHWFDFTRKFILLLLTLMYGIRLTWNFLRGWSGLKHEDWRYIDFRKKSGKAYWMISYLGIHLFPALIVFGGSLSIWVTVSQGIYPFGVMDVLAVSLTGFAIWLEANADRQLRRFILQNKEAGKTMDLGLWSVSRHPNYLGEISFWWGLYLFSLAANPSFWWVIIGPAAITLMFVFISIPLIEKRMLVSKKDYADYRKRVPMLVPFKFRPF